MKELQSVAILLQIGASIITQGVVYYKKGRFVTKWDSSYKLGQELLPSGAGNLFQCGSVFIVTCSRYYSVGQLYPKIEQLLQKRPVYLRDAKGNGNPYFPTGPIRFENGILYDIIPFRLFKLF